MKEKAKNGRLVEQDIAKGISIIGVMILHIVTIKKQSFFILGGLLGFILPFFFLIAGYNYRPGKYTARENIKRRTKQLLIPLFMYVTVIVIVFGSYYYYIGEYSLRQIIDIYLTALLSEPFALLLGIKVAFKGLWHCVFVSWFIQMFFVGEIIFFLVVDWCLSSMARFFSVCIGLTTITMIFAHFDLRLPFYLSEAPAIAVMMLLGAAFGRNKLLEPVIEKKKIVLNAVVAYTIFLVLGVMFRGAGMMMGGRMWKGHASVDIGEWSVIVTIVVAITGSYAFVHFCRLLTRFKALSAGLSWCGNHTLQIMLLHNSIQLVVCKILGMEPFRISPISDINDYRTFGVLAIVLVINVVIIKIMEMISAKIKTGK